MTLRVRWRPGDRYLVRHFDRTLMVIEKQAGILCHRTQEEDYNLLDLLRDFVAGRGGGPVLPIHRLDRNVSGLLVYARVGFAERHLIEQFASHYPQRRYLAMCEGVLEQDQGTYDSLLQIEDPTTRVYSVDYEGPGIRRGVTHWRVLERLPNATFIEVELETGLRNQIRVHFAEAGHPLLGERKYARKPKPQERQRIFLHAAQLGFEHPQTHEFMRFEARLPPDLWMWKKQVLRGDRNQDWKNSGPRSYKERAPREGARMRPR